MTFNQLWAQLQKRHSSLKQDDATLEFRPASLKKLLEQVYEQGRKSAECAGKPSESGPFDGFFKKGGRG